MLLRQRSVTDPVTRAPHSSNTLHPLESCLAAEVVWLTDESLTAMLIDPDQSQSRHKVAQVNGGCSTS